jgi:integrase/recombinase XerD
MSGLHGKLEEYLAVRRAMGFKMERHEKLLGQYASFLDANGESAVTIDNAVAWAMLPAEARTRWHALRLSMVRGFAAWLNAADPAHQVPPGRMISHRSGADVQAMMPRLSAYLGHADPRHTYSYMSAADAGR